MIEIGARKWKKIGHQWYVLASECSQAGEEWVRAVACPISLLDHIEEITAKLHAAESRSWNEALDAAIASCAEVGWMSRSFQAEFTRKIEGLKKPEPSATLEGADL